MSALWRFDTEVKNSGESHTARCSKMGRWGFKAMTKQLESGRPRHVIMRE
jgi:hypothetical protein